ncbi:MAG: hypothetical protein ACFFG0_05595, partial [Candidatus Thorarchaeota archaeon]
MNQDFRVSTDFWDHHKTVRLKKELGYAGIEALQRLWSYTAKFRPNGYLTNMDNIDIAIACKWEGDADRLVEVLSNKKYPWIEKNGDHYKLHNWEKRNGFAVHAEERSEKARKAANKRWEKNQQDNANSMRQAMLTDATSNAPSPTPTPTPTKEKIYKKENQEKIKKAFYKIYPRKEAEEEANTAIDQFFEGKGKFKKLKPITEDKILCILKQSFKHIRYKNKHDLWGEKDFIPLPASWFRGWRWRDELPSPEELRNVKSNNQNRGSPKKTYSASQGAGNQTQGGNQERGG